MRLSDSTIADAPNTHVLETPAQFFARGGVVTVVVPARARGFVESLSKAKRHTLLRGNTMNRTNKYETVSNTGHRRHGRAAGSLGLHHRLNHTKG
jgi:hypothetical protein